MRYSARSREEVEDEEGRRKTSLHAREEEGGGEEEKEEGNPSLSFLRKRSERVKCILSLGDGKWPAFCFVVKDCSSLFLYKGILVEPFSSQIVFVVFIIHHSFSCYWGRRRG